VRGVDNPKNLGGRGLLEQQFVAFGGAFCEFALEFYDNLLDIGCRIVRCLSHFDLLILSCLMNSQEQPIQKDRAALVVQSLFIFRTPRCAASQQI
jgi:hypothetical protein